MEKGMLFIVSGFSGAGKGTVMNWFRSREEYALSVSCTSRSPREGEVNGRDYFFIDHEDFLRKAAGGYFLEYAIYTDHGYGTPAGYVNEKLEAGKDVILEIELQGAMQVKEKCPDAVLIFLTAPSAKELERRLKARGTETPEQIRKRLKRAAEESLYMDRYDYIIVNDDLDTCISELHWLMRSLHKKSGRQKELIAQLQRDLPLLTRDSV